MKIRNRDERIGSPLHKARTLFQWWRWYACDLLLQAAPQRRFHLYTLTGQNTDDLALCAAGEYPTHDCRTDVGNAAPAEYVATHLTFANMRERERLTSQAH